jgi:hypothetical protein
MYMLITPPEAPICGLSRSADPGHYVDLDEQGRVFGILALEELPATREGYDTRLRAGGHTQYTAGYLPYSLLSGWQQVRKDFAWVRAATAGLAQAETAEDRAFFTALLVQRQALALHNIGLWSHYVADASQPLHVSVHYNGWGNFPNPRGFTQARTIHAQFESDFVRAHANWEAVAALVPPPVDCGCPIQQRLRTYLRATLAQVEPLYELELTGAFREAGTPAGLDFVHARLAAGVAELRDLILEAWRSSATAQIGYPPLEVTAIEAGRLRVTRGSFWRD